MSAQVDAGVHRIEVERADNGDPISVRFVCTGTADSACHLFPDCECEQWTAELHGVRLGQRISDGAGAVRAAGPDDVSPAAPGHEDVRHESTCWVEPWFNGVYEGVIDWLEAYDDGRGEIGPGALRSGAVDTTFEGDYMTWRYAS